ncbi:hypothetical protein E2320_010617 [Naja naja]|nr:hypothetical protein E2320_010617 [Naja naja]
MAALNSFAPFDTATETWESYIEGFNCFLEMNDLIELTSSRRRALFLNLCGKQMYDTARAFLAPQLLSTVSWAKTIMPQRHPELPEDTHFTDLIKLKESRSTNMWRDCERLPCTLKSTVPERKTLAVHQEEAIDEDIELTGDDDIHQLKTASGNKWPMNKTPQSQTCIGCGGNHPRAACRFKTANCRRCGKRGHLAKMCKAILPDDRVQTRPVPAKGTPRKFPKLGEDCFKIQRDNYLINPRIGQTNLSIKRKNFLTVKIEGHN